MTVQAFDFNRCLTSGKVVQQSGKFVVDTPARPFLERMQSEEDLGFKISLAARALRHDPGCIKAHLFLSDYAKTDEIRLNSLRAAVIAGDVLWGPVAAKYGDSFNWMAHPDAAVYWDAIVSLGEELERNGQTDEARKFYEKALKMYEAPDLRFNLEQLENGSILRL